jgi:hypothetical protein
MRLPSHHLPGLADVPVSAVPAGRESAGTCEIEHAVLTPALLDRVLDAALAARSRALAGRTVAEIIGVIVALAKSWNDPSHLGRQQALEALPTVTGLSPAMIAETIPGLFAPYTAHALHAFVRSEVGSADALDGMVATPWGKRHATGPELVVHFAAGNVPGLSLPVLITALLAKAAIVIKPAEGEPVLAALIARQLAALDPEIGACVAVAYWPGGTRELEDAVLSRGGVVIIEGDDDAVAAIRARAPGRVLGFGRRVSLAVVTREATGDVPGVAAALARDVSLHDQQGCLSPQVIYVETGGAASPAEFAASLGEALTTLSRALPCGNRTLDERGAARAFRDDAEWRRADGREVQVHAAGTGTTPLVVYESDARFEPTCLQRTVRVKPLDLLDELPSHLGTWAHLIEAIGVAAPPERMERLALAWGARSSVSRVCPIGRMQEPPIGWRHGGLPRLGALLRWTDVEFPGANT